MTQHKSPSSQILDPKPNPPVILELIQYNESEYEKLDNLPIKELLLKLKNDQINWINVDGLHDHNIIKALGKRFGLHALLLEDITSDHQPKAEEYEEYLFFTLKMLYRIEFNEIEYEQISFVLGKDYLLSFQDKEGDLFNPFRERIRMNQGKVRKQTADYLLYRLIDVIIDNYYVVLDAVGQQIEQIEADIYSNPSEKEFYEIQRLKKELIFLRKALHPLRDALSKIIKDESGFIQETTKRYFADVYDHVVHLIDSMDTYKDLTSSLMDIHINTLNTRMNEVIKVLTVISTIFIPLTFIVGIYGMNFRDMPEINYEYGYPLTWLFMILIVFAMLWYFKYRKWF